MNVWDWPSFSTIFWLCIDLYNTIQGDIFTPKYNTNKMLLNLRQHQLVTFEMLELEIAINWLWK